MGMYTIEYKISAQEDLKEIKNYIFKFTFSKEIAENSAKKILGKTYSLKIFPKICPVFKGDLRVMTIDKKYRVFYKIFEEEKRVVIYYIFNSGEDYDSLIH